MRSFLPGASDSAKKTAAHSVQGPEAAHRDHLIGPEEGHRRAVANQAGFLPSVQEVLLLCFRSGPTSMELRQ